MSLTLLGFATALLGLVVIIPILGHASQHAWESKAGKCGMSALFLALCL